MSLIDWKTFDPERLRYTVCGQKPVVIHLTYLDSQGMPGPLCWETPLSKAPFGVTCFPPRREPLPNGTVPRYKLFLEVSDPGYQAFLEKVDACLLEAIFENQEEWFPHKPHKTREVIKRAYIPLLRPPHNDTPFTPSTRFQCDASSTIFRGGASQGEMTADQVPQGCMMKAFCAIHGLWAISCLCGAQAYVHDAVVS